MFVFRGFFTQKPQNAPKTEKNNQNLLTLKLIMVSTENFSKPVWEKHPKQPKHSQNRKPIDLFAFYCHSINLNNNTT